nr:MAG TPA: hypothetical protein [Caudoviricetes sp.]DAT09921.1 MAG TPA: hypothetical protein [Caudoviricetes sp.]
MCYGQIGGKNTTRGKFSFSNCARYSACFIRLIL